GRVAAAGGIVFERLRTGGRVAAGCVCFERLRAGGRIVTTGCVAKESARADGGITLTHVVDERVIAQDRGPAAVEVATFLTNRPRWLRNRKAGQREQRKGRVSNIRYCFHTFISFHYP